MTPPAMTTEQIDAEFKAAFGEDNVSKTVRTIGPTIAMCNPDESRVPGVHHEPHIQGRDPNCPACQQAFNDGRRRGLIRSLKDWRDLAETANGGWDLTPEMTARLKHAMALAIEILEGKG